MMLFIALLLLACFQGLSAIQWTSAYRNTSKICLGSDLMIGCDYILKPGETVDSIKWSFVSHYGHKPFVIAVYGFGYFNANPSYAKRLTRLSRGTVVLASVTSKDVGTYKTEIVTRKSAKSFVTMVKYLVVTVAVPSDYRNTRLSLKMDEEAVADVRGDFHVRFWCGPLAWRGDANVDVIWTTPSGAQRNSTGYLNEYFYLIPNFLVEDGVYTCGLPASAIHTLCLRADDALAKKAVLKVNRNSARLVLVEARLRRVTKRLKQAEETQLQFQNLTSIRVGFHARVNTPNFVMDRPGTIKFSLVSYNDGSAYDNTTGKFTAPVYGVYFFAVTAFSYDLESYGSCLLMVDNDIKSYIPSEFNGYPATGHAVLRLEKGNTVWVRISRANTKFYKWSIFSGFLVHPDW